MTSEFDRKQRKPAAKGTAAQRKWGGQENPFVNVNLDEEQNIDKAAWCPDYPTLLDVLQKELESGYSITIKYDDYSSAIACFLRSGPDDEENAGLVLTGRGGTGASALREALYIHVVVLERNWRNAKPRTSRDFSADAF